MQLFHGRGEEMQTSGIHHITAIVGHPQENVDFYGSVLGLRLLKKTVNFDDPGTYHLYFGDEQGSPGTIITFFPWADGRQGALGGGQVAVSTYVIPKGSISFWKERLYAFDIFFAQVTRFGEDFLYFFHSHGLIIERDERETSSVNTSEHGKIHQDVAIQGFGGAVLYSANPDETREILTGVLGLDFVEASDEFMRFQALAELGNIIDVDKAPRDQGVMGVGTVHHIAWRAEDRAEQRAWQKFVREKGFLVTEVKDRNYFHAIYFRETGSILFEIATDPPGFGIDEKADELGENLMLPSQLEKYREE